MSVYMTEEEQLQAIKTWWKRYSNLITVILSLILLTIAGYRYWNWHQEKVAIEASNAYESLMIAFSNRDARAIKSYANLLIKDHKNTVYSDVAHLTLAKLYVSQDKFNEASKELEYVANTSKNNTFKQIAKIRRARLLVAGKSYQQALAQLSRVDDQAYVPVINELKGDIYAATGKYAQAFAAYRQAIQEVRVHGMGNLFLEMKTNELAALTQTMNTTKRVSGTA